jgi:hypothetical protein
MLKHWSKTVVWAITCCRPRLIIPGILFYLLIRTGLRLGLLPRNRAHGILIFNGDLKSADYTPQIIQALDLIQCVDPRRFQRVKREVRVIRIFHRKPGSNYSYRRIGRVCSLLAYGISEGVDRSAAIRYTAIEIVGAATYGTLHSKRVPFCNAIRDRAERIRRAEQIRFGKKLWELGLLPFD